MKNEEQKLYENMAVYGGKRAGTVRKNWRKA